MVEIGPCIALHEKEPYRDWKIGDEGLIALGIDWCTPAFNRRAQRLKLHTVLNSLQRRWSGLNHPVHGHMNKHYLKMKWLRRKEGATV